MASASDPWSTIYVANGAIATKGESMIHAVIIRTDGTMSVIDHCPTLSELQGAVGGLIAPIYGPEGITGYVNDEGLLIGLPLNLIASALGGQPLVGDAIITGPLDSKGETTPLAEHRLGTVLLRNLRRDLREVPLDLASA